MQLRNDDLKRLYRTFVSTHHPDNRQECPSWEQLLSFFEARARPTEKLKIVDHMTSCSACAQEFEFLLDLRRFQERIGAQIQGVPAKKSFFHSFPASVKRTHLFWRFASALVGLILVSVSLITIIQNGGREAGTRAARTSVMLLEPIRGQSATLPLTFKWEGWGGAESYVLELYDEALSSIWESPRTPQAHLVLPPEAERQLKPGGHYFWMITAYRHNEKIAESKLYEFTVIQKFN
jgi:hypothetical protein